MQRLEPVSDVLASIANHWPSARMEWGDATEPGTELCSYKIPAGFPVHLGPASLQLHHMCRIREFASVSPATVLLLHFGTSIAEVFHAASVVYAPDETSGCDILDLVRSGYGIQSILERLSPDHERVTRPSHLLVDGYPSTGIYVG